MLPGDYAALAVCIAVGAMVAWLVSRKQRGLIALGYLLAVAVWAVHLADSRLDCVWAWLIPHPAVVIIKLVAVWPVLIAVVLGLLRHLPKPRDRRALQVLTVALSLYGAYVLGSQLVNPVADSPSTWNGEALQQSTDATCVAAASATYLRTLGIEITEAQAARRGLISSAGGSLTQAYRILRLSVDKPTQVHIRRMDQTGLNDRHWRIVSLYLGPLTGHAVVMQISSDGAVIMRDPAAGESAQSWPTFRQQYLGTAVWAD